MATVKTLTPEAGVNLSRLALRKGDFQHRIAADFDLNQGRISEIATGKRFADIPPAAAQEASYVRQSVSSLVKKRRVQGSMKSPALVGVEPELNARSHAMNLFRRQSRRVRSIVWWTQQNTGAKTNVLNPVRGSDEPSRVSRFEIAREKPPQYL